jgi:hypothetical protein
MDIMPVWGARYLGLGVPALLMLLAFALRRLPMRRVRAVCVGFVIAASVASACSNYFVYRNPPYHEAAEIAARYYDRKNPGALAIGHLKLTNVGDPQANIIEQSYALARHARPTGSPRDVFVPARNFQLEARDAGMLISFVKRVSQGDEVRTIVVTDKAGDVTAPTELLSNEAILERLGPTWKLVEEQLYNSYCERFYLYNTWRTRVWQRDGAVAAAAFTREGSTGSAEEEPAAGRNGGGEDAP